MIIYEETTDMFGVEINYINGKKDWVDPCSEEPIEKDGVLFVENDCHIYEYPIVNLEKWFKYDLCKTCGYDVRTYECGPTECLNPRYDEGS